MSAPKGYRCLVCGASGTFLCRSHLEHQGTAPGLERLQRELHSTDVAVDAARALLREALSSRRPPKRLVREALRLLEKSRER